VRPKLRLALGVFLHKLIIGRVYRVVPLEGAVVNPKGGVVVGVRDGEKALDALLDLEGHLPQDLEGLQVVRVLKRGEVLSEDRSSDQGRQPKSVPALTGLLPLSQLMGTPHRWCTLVEFKK